MNRIVRRAAMLAALGMTALVSTAASATSFVFDTTSKTDSTASSGVFTATTGGASVSVLASAWHVASSGSIASAALGLYTPGLGVLASGESYSGNEHQIDNKGGVDFIELQFSQAVTLTDIGRAVFPLDGMKVGSDAAYKAASAAVLAAQTSWNQVVNLSSFSTNGSNWTTVAGGSSANTAALNTTDMSSIWLVGASFSGCDYDAFKLSSITVATPKGSTPPGAVPEPATWAMLLVGFGWAGSSMRRRKPQAARA